MNASHVVFDPRGKALVCRHCEQAQLVLLPVEVRRFVQISSAFLSEHESCVPGVEQSPKAGAA